jgi:hypothetical protein
VVRVLRRCWPRARWARWAVSAVLVAVLVPVLLLSGGCGWLLVENSGSPSPDARGSGTDALWLGHTWLDAGRSPAELAALVDRLRSARIRDVFVHAGPLADDGTLDPALRVGASALLDAVHRVLPSVRVQAWLGDVVGAGRLDVDDPATRARTVVSAGQVLDDGFDGVHYDLEPVADGDAGYLALLAATHHMTSARHAVLSVATDQLEPVAGLRYPEQWASGRPHFWSTGFLHDVALDVDEVAVMAYDSGVPFGAAYSGYLRVQTSLAMSAVPVGVDLVMGVPAYHTDETGHTSAETVAAAVRGVRLAWNGRHVGVALYADFSATPGDWAAYQVGWVDP